ncbi:Lysine transporter LysE [Hyella patelloides LEGE 07179]|uniref:Lysine transporter LysE n=1 Tax=Hyella patelloides LEGE 07179 TaxID=945734 RepID=A0A563VQW6_9CYAN|nr:LysE family translocator [Hyella patelloides]VEP13779.1 Lysine transporter LysE [Hyella patelloides LEGE 07179]
MINFDLISRFAVASLLLLATPGPDLLAMLGRGISQGRQAAIVTVVGYALGDVTHTIFAVVGLSALIQSSAIAFQIVKYFGALYLIYLGIQAIQNKRQFRIVSKNERIATATILRQSIISSILNPKTTLFFLAFLPQFVDVNAGKVQLQMLILGVVFMLLGMLVYFPVAYFSGVIGRWIQTRQAIASKIRWVTGSIFIGLGLRAALTENSS